MSAVDTCPHDREGLTRERPHSCYRCETCDARVCLDCGRYGFRHGTELVSWLTGVCEDCYRERDRRDHIRRRFRAEQRGRRLQQIAWNAGRSADADEGNPHDLPTVSESYYLSQNDWLRAEGGR